MTGNPSTGNNAGKDIVWTIRDPGGGNDDCLPEVVFALKAKAEEIDKVNKALDKAKTWRQFKKLMPPKEYRKVMWDTFHGDRDSMPKPDDDFSRSDIAGTDDGWYPDWQQCEMLKWFPKDLAQKYGQQADSLHEGPFLSILAKHVKDVVRELEERGYKVTRRRDLEFY